MSNQIVRIECFFLYIFFYVYFVISCWCALENCEIYTNNFTQLFHSLSISISLVLYFSSLNFVLHCLWFLVRCRLIKMFSNQSFVILLSRVKTVFIWSSFKRNEISFIFYEKERLIYNEHTMIWSTSENFPWMKITWCEPDFSLFLLVNGKRNCDMIVKR